MKTTFSRVSGMTPDQRAELTDRFDKASRISSAEPVAVVGIGCRFPGDVVWPEAYWEFLANGVDAITEVPSDRWDADAFYDPDPSAPTFGDDENEIDIPPFLRGQRRRQQR